MSVGRSRRTGFRGATSRHGGPARLGTAIGFHAGVSCAPGPGMAVDGRLAGGQMTCRDILATGVAHRSVKCSEGLGM